MVDRHLVLTRAVYAPHLWTSTQNRRRLALFKGVTAQSLSAARRLYDRWQWIVMVHRDDPFKAERIEIVRSVDPAATVLEFADGGSLRASTRHALLHRVGAFDWRTALRSRDSHLLTTRIDDDDAFAPDALQRISDAASGLDERTALVLPRGVRVWAGSYSHVRHDTNAWASIWSPRGDASHAFDFNHRQIADVAPVRFIDQRPGWLWVRHVDTLNDDRSVDRPLDTAVRSLFPIHWPLLERATREAGISEEALVCGRYPMSKTPGDSSDGGFWQRRHHDLKDIRAVGSRHKTVATNEQEYAQAADEFRRHVARDFGAESARGSVLDLGYGFGHYAKLARELRFTSYTGVDIAAPPGPDLGPTYVYKRGDISAPVAPAHARFDLVLAIDVLFHVIDEAGFMRVLANIRRHAARFVYVTGKMKDERVAPHVLHRSLSRFRELGALIDVTPWRDTKMARFRVADR